MKRNRQLLATLLLAMTGLTIFAAETAIDLPPEKVPGVVISHYPGVSGPYIGSPSITILPDGSYVASHDLFGPNSTQNTSGHTLIFGSQNRGASWKKLTELSEAFWSTLFVHRDKLYLIGTSKQYGDVVIRRSADGGNTWTEPEDAFSGLLNEGAQYHCAPMPVIVHNGRIWRAMEQCNPKKGWGVKFRAGMLSASIDSDLLKRDSWTFSNFLSSDTSWVNRTFGGWLEGNAVATPDGKIVDILRVETKGYPEQAAVVNISADGKLAWFDPLAGFIDMPGGAKKFTIRYDAASRLYWTLTNDVPERHRKSKPGGVRNTVSLACSKDLESWTVVCNVLYHPNKSNYGFQYIDWQFDGNDMIFVSRTAYNDGVEGAHNTHDANYLTFHRIENFREATMDDSVPYYRMLPMMIKSAELTVTGHGWTLTDFKEGGIAYANRTYVWIEVPEKLKKGCQFTRMSGGVTAELSIEARKDTVVQMFTSVDRDEIDLKGWEKVDELQFRYTDGGKTLMHMFERKLRKGGKLDIPQGNWSGCMLLLPADAKRTQ